MNSINSESVRHELTRRFPPQLRNHSPNYQPQISSLDDTISHGASPTTFQSIESPVSHYNAGVGHKLMESNVTETPGWSGTFDLYNRTSLSTNSTSAEPTTPMGSNHAASVSSPSVESRALVETPPPPLGSPPYRLSIHPLPTKSRVETQIPIRLSLHPMPRGVKKIHLEKHTIMRPKLWAKPSSESTPDTLELTVSVVCTTPMQEPTQLQRAMLRAQGVVKVKVERGNEHSPPKDSSATTGPDEERPINGGEVQSCSNCIGRERRRQQRRKVKKLEEEEAWLQDEARRIVVFNTHELKDWQQLSAISTAVDLPDCQVPDLPAGAMFVDLPMRITCYCRHHGEKIGFRVIFTLKDWQDRVMAQAITPSISITDDHKTHPPIPAMPHGMSMDHSNPHPPGSNMYVPNSSHLSHIRGFGATQFRGSMSSPNLAGLNDQYIPPYRVAHSRNNSHSESQASTAPPTPRNISRPASPQEMPGHTAKKRKSGGISRLPPGLVMTKMDPPTPLNPAGLAYPTSHPTSPFSSDAAYLSSNGAINFRGAPPSAQQYAATGPSTPNHPMMPGGPFGYHNRSQSYEDVRGNNFNFSAVTSAQPSRPASPPRHNPTGGALGPPVSSVAAAAAVPPSLEFAQAVSQGLYNIPTNPSPSASRTKSPPPTINEIIPPDGATGGGYKVAIMGSNFAQGMEVLFGSVRAVTTTFWGDSCLVCLVPPCAMSGLVSITLRHDARTILSSFRYVDRLGDEQARVLMAALSRVVAERWGVHEGGMEAAVRILNEGGR